MLPRFASVDVSVRSSRAQTGLSASDEYHGLS